MKEMRTAFLAAEQTVSLSASVGIAQSSDSWWTLMRFSSAVTRPFTRQRRPAGQILRIQIKGD